MDCCDDIKIGRPAAARAAAAIAEQQLARARTAPSRSQLDLEVPISMALCEGAAAVPADICSPGGTNYTAAAAQPVGASPEPDKESAANCLRILFLCEIFLAAYPGFDPNEDCIELSCGMQWPVLWEIGGDSHGDGKYHVVELYFSIYKEDMPAEVYNQAAIAKLQGLAKDKKIEELQAVIVTAEEASVLAQIDSHMLAQIDSVCAGWDAPGTPSSASRDAICKVARILFFGGFYSERGHS